MKKSFILLFTVTLYTLGVLNFAAQNHNTVYADEIDKPSEPKTTAMELKTISLDEKDKEHKRFEEEKKEEHKQTVKDDVKRTVNVEATAYTAFCEGCSGTTYTGIDLRANPDKKVIAVDPDIIPLGSKVRVPGYGVAVAGDIGGDIQGHRIDVFIPEEGKAFDFGRRQVEVEILES
ncbi:3D domain-containing protein [Halobacillus sp. BBL2006]|uniref:3D domain-containing protein n=1 Tax=Halobacillus sp. BBL2006 TaxID=1543706 RepID=UPI0009DF6DD0